jgi:hypothetical protein
MAKLESGLDAGPVWNQGGLVEANSNYDDDDDDDIWQMLKSA